MVSRIHCDNCDAVVHTPTKKLELTETANVIEMVFRNFNQFDSEPFIWCNYSCLAQWAIERFNSGQESS